MNKYALRFSTATIQYKYFRLAKIDSQKMDQLDRLVNLVYVCKVPEWSTVVYYRDTKESMANDPHILHLFYSGVLGVITSLLSLRPKY